MKLALAEEIHSTKYRGEGETFGEYAARVANALKDNEDHFRQFKEILYEQRFLPGGRVQSAIGAPKQVTPYNCYVSGTIPDDMSGIMRAASDAAQTMRMGGGIGYDFSTLRPRGDIIRTLDSQSSGPVSFMGIFDAVCRTISSSGHRRGAQMGVLRVDHPDIEAFIRAKHNSDQLTGFNISVGITDAFMEAVVNDKPFDLKFNGRVYKTISASSLWEEIMRSTWEWAEPGVLFLDRIREQNNLFYCETISATNPCGEQPLPPYGACLLGSFNLVKYVEDDKFNYEAMIEDIPHVVRAMDNIVDVAIYPLPEQEAEAKNKRRMGLGVTGLANASEIMGHPYGTMGMLNFTEEVLKTLANECYKASVELAKEKGPFPLYNKLYLKSQYIKKLDPEVIDMIAKYGIRNSHLTSIAPTGTISLTADNVSSGIEPVWNHSYDRTIQTFDGPMVQEVSDYAYREHGVKGKLASDCSADDHVNTLLIASKWMDSAVSKTCNVDPSMQWEDFKNIYFKAWKGGAKGCTTFNPGGKRFGILSEAKPVKDDLPEEGAACYIDPETGEKSCE